MQIVTSQVNKLLLFVEQFTPYDFSGHFSSPLEEQEIPFSSFAELLLKMEQQFDWLRFPQRALEARSFLHDTGQSSPAQENPEPPAEVETYPYPAANGTKKYKAKFYLHVYFRQNASWQGRIEWLDTMRSVDFRSALELLHLVTEALQDTKSGSQHAKRA